MGYLSDENLKIKNYQIKDRAFKLVMSKFKEFAIEIIELVTNKEINRNNIKNLVIKTDYGVVINSDLYKGDVLLEALVIKDNGEEHKFVFVLEAQSKKDNLIFDRMLNYYVANISNIFKDYAHTGNAKDYYKEVGKIYFVLISHRTESYGGNNYKSARTKIKYSDHRSLFDKEYKLFDYNFIDFDIIILNEQYYRYLDKDLNYKRITEYGELIYRSMGDYRKVVKDMLSRDIDYLTDEEFEKLLDEDLETIRNFELMEKFNEGMEKGRIEGISEGIEKGIEKGRSEGISEGIQLVFKFLKELNDKNIDGETIEKYMKNMENNHSNKDDIEWR